MNHYHVFASKFVWVCVESFYGIRGEDRAMNRKIMMGLLMSGDIILNTYRYINISFTIMKTLFFRTISQLMKVSNSKKRPRI